MKKSLSLMVCLFSMILPGICQDAMSLREMNEFTKDIKFLELGARKMSLSAVNSFPQKILDVLCLNDTVTIVKLSTFNEWEDSVAVKRLSTSRYSKDKDYPDSIIKYLGPTALINSESIITRSVADSLFSGEEQLTGQVIQKALDYTARIKYDEDLAASISNGITNSIPSDSVITTMSGTCGEATNVFIALMRQKKIPTRYIIGFAYEPSIGIANFHAWAEVFIDGFGWWGVDPQNGSIVQACYAYKLLEGADFEDCGINQLTDIFMRGERWLIIKELSQ